MCVKVNDRQVYVGDLRDASDLSFLRKNNITAMLSVVHGAMSEYEDVVKVVNTMKISHQHIDVADSPQWSLIPYFSTISTFINSNESTLVHCVSGVSRSSTCVLIYMIQNGYQLDVAYRKLCQVYPNASPAPWFMAELRAFNNSNGKFPRHDYLDAPLFLRAAAVGVPLKPYSNCDCPPIRCRKCRSSLFRACAPFGGVSRTSLLLAQTIDLISFGESMKCKKCGSKIGTLTTAIWLDGVDAGIETVPVYQVHASRVDFPLGVQWPSSHPNVRFR